MKYNKEGLKYFMYMTSFNNNFYLPIEIRRLIWKKCHLIDILQCFYCNKILINFNFKKVLVSRTLENYLTINGRTKCNDCFFD
jgi:hypothetical protein